MEEEKRLERNKYQNGWIKENKERINIPFEKGTKARILAVLTGESVSEYVRKAVEMRLSGIPENKIFSSEKKELIFKAAQISGLSVKDFICETVYARAEEIVKEAEAKK